MKSGVVKTELKSGNQLKVEQSRSELIGQRIDGIGKVFYQLIGNGVAFVDDVEYFETQPHVLKFPEWTVESSDFFITEQ